MAHWYSTANDIGNLNVTLVYGSGVNKVKGHGSLVLKTFYTFFQTPELAMGEGLDEQILNKRKLKVIHEEDSKINTEKEVKVNVKFN